MGIESVGSGLVIVLAVVGVWLHQTRKGGLIDWTKYYLEQKKKEDGK